MLLRSGGGGFHAFGCVGAGGVSSKEEGREEGGGGSGHGEDAVGGGTLRGEAEEGFGEGAFSGIWDAGDLGRGVRVELRSARTADGRGLLGEGRRRGGERGRGGCGVHS